MNEKQIVVVVSSLDDLFPLYLLLYDEESLAQCGILFWNLELKFIKVIAYWYVYCFVCKSSMVQAREAPKVNEKKIVVVVSSLDDLCPLYLLLYDEESLAQCRIIF